MKIKSKYYLKDREGETRLRRKFLLWPRCFSSNKHWYWLCWAYIREEIVAMDVGGSMEWGNYAWVWREVGIQERSQ